MTLALLNGVVGWGLVLFCSNSFSLPLHEIGVFMRLCMIVGFIMGLFVFLWISYILCMWKVTPPDPSQKVNENSSRKVTICVKVAFCLGMLSLVLLAISIIADVGLTVMMWWVSSKLDEKYKVVGDCFCEKEYNASTEASYMLDIKCPVVAGFECKALYGSTVLNVGGLEVHTSDCQSLSARSRSNACLEFMAFWDLFRVLRIVLPMLAVIKLPVLVSNCKGGPSRARNGKPNSDKFTADSNSWTGINARISPLKFVDPVEYYTGMCTPVKLQAIPLGERLSPVGQERDECNNGNPTLNTHKLASFQMKIIPVSRISAGHFQQEGEATAKVLTPPKKVLTSNESPPGHHTISTPKHARLETPSFDLSKVSKIELANSIHGPVIKYTNSNSLRSRPLRLSSFNSVHGCIPSDPLTPLSVNTRCPPAPPLRISSLPRPLRKTYSEGSNNADDNRSSGVFTSEVLQSVEDTPNEDADSVFSAESTSRLQPQMPKLAKPRAGVFNSYVNPSSPTVLEIVQRARRHSKANVDWNRLP